MAALAIFFGLATASFTCSHAVALTIDRCRSARGWPVGYYNDDLRRPDPTRPATGWARYFVLASFVIGELVNSVLVDG